MKPDIASLDGNRVLFKDGTAEAIDTIVFATGSQPVVPFMDESLIFAADGKPRLLVNVVHPEHEGLFAAGLAQANGSMWRLADYQGQMIANLIVAGQREPQRARRFRDMLAAAGKSARVSGVIASDRHRLEVNYHDYRRQLKRLMRRFGPVRRMNLDPSVSSGAALRAPAEAAE